MAYNPFAHWMGLKEQPMLLAQACGYPWPPTDRSGEEDELSSHSWYFLSSSLCHCRFLLGKARGILIFRKSSMHFPSSDSSAFLSSLSPVAMGLPPTPFSFTVSWSLLHLCPVSFTSSSFFGGLEKSRVLGRAGHSSGASGQGAEPAGLGSSCPDLGSLGMLSPVDGVGLGSLWLLVLGDAALYPPLGLGGSCLVSWPRLGSLGSLWAAGGKQREAQEQEIAQPLMEQSRGAATRGT